MTDTLKQVIVMRTDLNMRKGKMISQGSHASMKVFFDLMRPVAYHHSDESLQMLEYVFDIYQGPKRPGTEPVLDRREMASWKEGAFTKAVVRGDSEEHILDLLEQAIDAGLPNALITDSGKTEFNGVPTKTCIAIGPGKASVIDKITGNLKLL